MNRIILYAAIIITSIFIFSANVPAPYWACNGKKEGDKCSYGYGCSSGGICKVIKKCKDRPDTKVNECLQCRH